MMSPRQKLLFDQWRAHGLPERLDGKSFLDIGCWEGDICVEAMRRGAKDVVGVDFCVCDDLVETLDKFKVPQPEKDELLAAISTLKKDIVDK